MDKMMSQKEAKRGQVMELLMAGKTNQKEAGKMLAVSVRQIKRILRRYRTAGLPGLISKKRGRASNRRVDETIRTTAIKVIGERYRDFGPTLAAEKLAELHGIHLSVESARQLMISAGYWKPRKGATISVHPMRERRARLGELVQIDGSPHDWFEGRADRCTLLVFIDDATGRLLQLRFAPTERPRWGTCMPCMTISWHTGYLWRSTATNTAFSASMPKGLIRRLKHNLGGRRGNWG